MKPVFGTISVCNSDIMLRNPLYKYGPKTIQIPANLHFGEFVLEKLLDYGDRELFINAATGESYTYKQIAQDAVRLAISLTELGIGKGQTIAICSESRIEFWSTAIAIMCTGATLTTINSTYTAYELKYIMNISKPKYIFCSPYIYQVHSKGLNTLKFLDKIIIYGDEASSHILLYKNLISKDINPANFVVADVQGQTDIVLILYSSGTTGMPKGVMITHHNAMIACNMTGKDPNLPVSTLTIAPWFHAMGLMTSLNAIVGGNKIVYLPRFEEKLYLQTIEKYKINVIITLPPVIVILSKSKLLNSYNLNSVILIYSGAAPLDVETIIEFKKRFPNSKALLQGYGMTECVLTLTRDDESAPKPGSVGRIAVAGCVIKVVDTETRKPLGSYQQGEICVKGPMVMKGYVGKDKKEDFDEEGFFRTGDIGYYDDDEYFFIVDRIKELIKYKGYQVPPAEIEGVLLQHPGVLDVGVVGVPKKNVGGVPIAFIVKNPNSNVTDEELKQFVADRLSNPKHLRGGVKFVSEIPKNPTGKILRRNLRNLLKTEKSKL